MALFDDIKKAVTDIGQEASQKTKSFTDGVKINSQISDQKKNLSLMYEDLGRILYKEESVRSNSKCSQILEWIDKGENNLKKLEQQLAASKGAVACKKCGNSVPAGNAFCQNCGTKVEVQSYNQQQNANDTQG
ncbi:MAG: zinc ribbon domain-containing protein [Lachnospiraceae bacterium]|nr:zinc ribbon domain-containing protein [Lachnospiraceae bacterium]